MEAPAWILVIFLSIALFIFLVVGIILLIGLIRLTKEAKKIMIQGQGIAETAGDIAENVRDFTTVGGLVRYFVDTYMDSPARRRRKSGKKVAADASAKKAKKQESEEEENDE